MTHEAENSDLAFKTPNHVRRNFSLTIISLIAVSLFNSCGKVGPPLPPVRRIQIRPEQLSVVQRGTMIVLGIPRPDLRGLDARGFTLDRIDIYRLIEPTSTSTDIDEDRFSERALMIHSIGQDVVARTASRESLVVEDGPITNFSSRYHYAARYLSKRGQHGPLSSLVAIQPQGNLPEPPTNVTAADHAQDAVVITWAAPQKNVDGSTPAAVIGYNIYRKQAHETTFAGPLNDTTPVTTTFHLDRSFKYETAYTYIVRSVSTAVGGGFAESLDSIGVNFTPKDGFPPAPPDGLTAASASGVVSLFWTANSEPDLAGYNVFRAESGDTPTAQWTKLNPTPHTLTTFRDDQAQIGRRYLYRVTSVDRTGNESRPSAIISQEVL